MRRWQQTAVDALFVVTEAVAWFAAITLAATASERSFLNRMEDRLVSGIAAGEVSGARAAEVLDNVRRAADSIVAGPSVLVVAATGLAAFFLMRWLTRAGIGGGFGALVLLLASVVALNLALHLALAGDLWVWDNAGLARFVDDPAAQFPEQLDLASFVASPRLGGMHGTSLSIVFLGFVAMWVRFLVAGRSAANFDRILRSFTVGFFVVFAVLVVARLVDVGSLAPYAIVFFIMGLLALAVAHSARRQAAPGEAPRTAPWAVSVSFTLAVLTASAVLLGLLALLDAGRPVEFMAGLAGRVIGWVLVLILTPIFWLIETLLRPLLPEGLDNMFDGFQDAPPDRPEQEPAEGLAIPGLVVDLLKALGILVLIYGAFRFARAILLRLERSDKRDYAEVRQRTEGGAGIGDLLRNLVPRSGRRGAGREWMRRHAVYRLFGRMVAEADERGLRRRPGETPLEFGATGSRLLDAPAFVPIARLFDRARYGRHFPEADEVERLQRDLASWQAAHPPTEEQRERIAGARPLDEAERIRLGVELARRAARGDPNARRDYRGSA